MPELLDRIARLVELGRSDAASPYPPDLVGQDGVRELVLAALAAGIAPREVLFSGLVAGMKRVGDRFRSGELFLPEVLMAARALSAGFEHLRPSFASGAVQLRGTIVIGTVTGDLHDIGKRIVALFFEGGGWKVIDLGVDVPVERFLAAIAEYRPQAVGLSTLLTTTLPAMANIAGAIKRHHPEVRVILGGAPVTPDFAARCGADAGFDDPQAALDYLDSASRQVER